jgi:diguanylate cyclase (GGDEF)-like protein
MKVLIIDDSQESLNLAKARLAKENLDFICAGSGPEGLDKARESQPDLILLDLDMPGMSGFEVCRALKEDVDTCAIPVIFLTGSDDSRNKVKGLDLGAVDYVAKPFDSFELRARVRAALRTKHMQDLLIKYAQIDPLTEIWNRRALMERMRQEWARIQRHGGTLSFIMADVDYFKRVNDEYGHQMGDRVLQEITKVFQSHCRETDFPTRFGGEEFAILVSDEHAEGAAMLAERCREGVRGIRMKVDDRELQITASFGVADSTGAANMEEMVKRSDNALYFAKQSGRDCVKMDRSTCSFQSGPSSLQSGPPIGF